MLQGARQGLMVLNRGIRYDVAVKVVQLHISGVNCEVVLSLGGGLIIVSDLLQEALAYVLELLPQAVSSVVNVSSLKVTDWLLVNREVTKLKDARLGSLSLDGIVLVKKGLSA